MCLVDQIRSSGVDNRGEPVDVPPGDPRGKVTDMTGTGTDGSGGHEIYTKLGV